MAVRLVGPHGQARVEQEYAAVGPGREQAALVARRGEGRVVVLEADVHVAERGGRGGGRAHGECEAVRLVDVVVGVLAEDDDLDRGEGGVAGPVADC